MGGGHSDPQSTQNNGNTITVNSSGHSRNNIHGISSGGGSSTQSGSSTGAGVTTKVSATIPAEALAGLMNLEATTTMHEILDGKCGDMQIHTQYHWAAKQYGLSDD